MGADLKRKEARERKFGGQNLESTSADKPPRKKLKQALPPLSAAKQVPTAENIAAGKDPVLDKSTDQGEEDESACPKAQRFIVFIGPSTLSKNARLSRLTALSLHQAIYLILHRMSQ